MQSIEVAAGVLTDASGRVLLMQRLPGKHLAGLWEFPGGKLEPGETVAQALSRELEEELGICVVEAAPLISIPWRYPEKTVRLHVCRVTSWRGEPRAREGHPLRWVPLRDMDTVTMPAADVPIVAALRLPAVYVISTTDHMPSRFGVGGNTPPHPDHLPQTRLGEMETSAQRSAGDGEIDGMLYQLRLPKADRGVSRATVAAWLSSKPALRHHLLINHDIELARELGIGVHLRSTQLRELQERPLPVDAWVGASCHDAEELDLAANLGADFATLSPVCVTVSHPAATPLGWQRFAQLVADARLPVYALGGVGPDDLASAHVAGAQGVAGIRAFDRGA